MSSNRNALFLSAIGMLMFAVAAKADTVYDFPSFTVTTSDTAFDEHNVSLTGATAEVGHFNYSNPNGTTFFTYLMSATFNAKPGWKFNQVTVTVSQGTGISSSGGNGGGQMDGMVTVDGLDPVYWALATIAGNGNVPGLIPMSGVPYNFGEFPFGLIPQPFTDGWSGSQFGPTHALNTTSFNALIQVDVFSAYGGGGAPNFGLGEGGANFSMQLVQTVPLPSAAWGGLSLLAGLAVLKFVGRDAGLHMA